MRKEANAAPMATTVVKAENVVHSAAIESANLMVIVAKVVTETVNHTTIVAKAAKEDPMEIVERAVKAVLSEETVSASRTVTARKAKDAHLVVTEEKKAANVAALATVAKEASADRSTARTNSAKVAKSAVDAALTATAILK